MIVIPETGYTFRMLSIDNGTNTLGASIVDLDLKTCNLTVIHSETCTASDSVERFDGMAEVLGDIYARYEVMDGFLKELLGIYDPNDVVVEGPFVHLNIATYEKLEGCIAVLRRAAYAHNCFLAVRKVAPLSAKKAVNAAKYQGKEPIRAAVLALTDVYYKNGIDPCALDEHCIDSIAVAYYRAQEVLRQVYRGKPPCKSKTS